MKLMRNTSKGKDFHSETLGNWARKMGVTYRTAWRWHRDGRLPKGVFTIQMPTGTILVTDNRELNQKTTDSATIYVRVNPRENPLAMNEQIDSCRRFCLAKGWRICKIIRERAPGVGSQRCKLARMFEERPSRLVVATESVLSRFDFAFYEVIWRMLGVELVVVDSSIERNGKGGALADLTDAINMTCFRHYGPKKGNALVEMLGKVVSGKVPV